MDSVRGLRCSEGGVPIWEVLFGQVPAQVLEGEAEVSEAGIVRRVWIVEVEESAGHEAFDDALSDKLEALEEEGWVARDIRVEQRYSGSDLFERRTWTAYIQMEGIYE